MLPDFQTDPYESFLDDRSADLPPDLISQLEALKRAPNGPAAGERALLAAVLHEAVLCAVGQANPPRGRRYLANQALRWLKSTKRDYLCAFETICDILGLEADAVRRKIFSLAGAAARSVNTSSAHDRRALRVVRKRVSRGPDTLTTTACRA